MRYRIGTTLILLATLMLSWVLGGWVGYRQVEKESVEESFRYRQLVANELNRYLPLPELMAEHPLLTATLEDPEDHSLVVRANRQMQRMAMIVGSSDVYLMDATGLTIAANNYRQANSFVGRNFNFRPYFQKAIETGGSATYFALGTTSGIRGLYFSHPVRGHQDNILGVIAMKVQVEELESQWRRPEHRTMLKWWCWMKPVSALWPVSRNGYTGTSREKGRALRLWVPGAIPITSSNRWTL